MRYWLGLIIGLFWVLNSLPQPAMTQSSSDAPYLYYYSSILNSFIIERADGTDSRLFGAGLMSHTANSIGGPGWSPSGEWFAWTGALIGGYGQYYWGSKPFVLNVDGKTRFTDLDHLNDAAMLWHPERDILLVAGSVQAEYFGSLDSSPEYTDVEVSMIDMATQEYIHQFTYHIDQKNYSHEGLPILKWSSDRKHAFLYNHVNSANQTDEFSYFYSLDLRGEYTYYTYPNHQRFYYRHYFAETLDSLGYILYIDKNTERLVIERLLDWQQWIIEGVGASHQGEQNPIFWNPQHTMAFLPSYPPNCQQSIDECPARYWLFQPLASGFTEISANIPPTIDFREWSENGESFRYQSRGRIYQFDTQTLTNKFFLQNNPVVPVCVADPYWFGSLVDLLACLGMSKNLDHVEVSFPHGITDIPVDKVINQSSYRWEQSPDGQFFAASYEGSLAFYDLQNNKFWLIAPAERSIIGVGSARFLWDSGSRWVLGSERWVLSIASVDGQIYREFYGCDYGLCGGWLPPQVPIQDLSQGQNLPIIPQPKRLIHANAWSYLLSWSPDGQKLLVYSDNFFLDFEFRLYDVETVAYTLLEVPSDYYPETGFVGTIQWDSATYLPTLVDATFEMISPNNEQKIDVHGKVTAIATGEIQHEFTLSYATFNYSSDSRLLVIGGLYGSVAIYDTITWQRLVNFNTNGESVAFSPDGQTLAVGSEWDIQLWDVEELLTFGELQNSLLPENRQN